MYHCVPFFADKTFHGYVVLMVPTCAKLPLAVKSLALITQRHCWYNRWCMLLAEWMQALLAEWELLRSVRVDAADAPMLLTVQAELAGAEARAEKERAARAARPAPEGKASAQAREDLRRGLRRSPEEVAVSDDLRAKLAIDVALKRVASRARRPADTTERTAVSLP